MTNSVQTMRRTPLSCLFACALLSVSGTQALSSGFIKRATLSGKIFDAKGVPIVGATVEAFGAPESKGSNLLDRRSFGRTVTKADGAFALTVMWSTDECLSLTLVAHKPNRAIGWSWWDSDRGHVQNLEIELSNPAPVAGTVVDESGKPVTGADIWAFVLDTRGTTILGASGMDHLARKTKRDGGFVFDTIPEKSKVALFVRAPGKAEVLTSSLFGDESKPFEAGRRDIKIVLKPGAVIEGKIVAKATGEPVPGVELHLRPMSPHISTYHQRSCVSDEGGVFRFADLCAGEWRFEMRSSPEELADWVMNGFTVILRAGQICTGLTPSVEKGAVLEFAARDKETNAPIPGALFVVKRSRSLRRYFVEADAKGIARVRVLPGTYRVDDIRYDQCATPPEVRQQKFRVNRGEIHREVYEIARKPQALGIVLDAKGEPVDGAIVYLVPDTWRDHITDARGRFDLTLDLRRDPGPGVSPMILARDIRRNLAVLAGVGDGKEMEIRLAEGVSLEGRVLNEDGQAIEGAHAHILVAFDNYGLYMQQHPLLTDDNGIYRLMALPAGKRYQIYVSQAEGYGTGSASVMAAYADSAVVRADDIVLRRARLSLAGIVVDENGKPLGGIGLTAYGEGQPFRQVKSDTEGKFRFESLCEGTVGLRPRNDTWQGSVVAEAGADDVKLVVGELDSYLRKVKRPKKRKVLQGKPLPGLEGLGLEDATAQSEGKSILLCFWNMEQRPSRRCLKVLATAAQRLRARNVTVVIVHAGPLNRGDLSTWLKERGGSFPAGTVAKSVPHVLETWGVEGLPWLILADAQHVVSAEGFDVAELDEKLKAISAD